MVLPRATVLAKTAWIRNLRQSSYLPVCSVDARDGREARIFTNETSRMRQQNGVFDYRDPLRLTIRELISSYTPLQQVRCRQIEQLWTSTASQYEQTITIENVGKRSS